MIDVVLSSVQYTSMVVAILSALVGVLGVIFVTLLGVYISRNRAEKIKLGEDEYKRERIEEKVLEQQVDNKKEKVKKPRHGKKNKQ